MDLSIFGDLALPPDFKSFAYVNPQAPKGGEIAVQPSGGGANVSPTTFNSFNDLYSEG